MEKKGIEICDKASAVGWDVFNTPLQEIYDASKVSTVDINQQFINLRDDCSISLGPVWKHSDKCVQQTIVIEGSVEDDTELKKPNLWCHVCNICNKLLKNKKLWNSHMEKHREDRPFLCDICESTFNFEENLIVHSYSEHFDKNLHFSNFLCPLCKKEFVRFAALKGHILSHQREDSIKCSKCLCSFPSKCLYLNHMSTCGLTNRDRNFQCKICKANYPNIGEFRKHMAKVHPSNLKWTNKRPNNSVTLLFDDFLESKEKDDAVVGVRKSKLNAQDKVSSIINSNKRNRPKRQNKSTSKPRICQKSAVKSVHTCADCGKSFKYPSMLTRHLVVHTKTNEFACPCCEKTYSQKHSLKIHLKSHDVDLNNLDELLNQKLERSLYRKNLYKKSRVACRYCHRSFASSTLQRIHIKIHFSDLLIKQKFNRTSESNIVHEVSKLPVNNNDLSRKMFRLMKINPLYESLRVKRKNERNWASTGTHQCLYCGNKYANKFHLTEHIKLKHQVDKILPTHECSICQKKFVNVSRLNRHVKFVHQKNGSKCHVCFKYFSSHLSLKHHMLIHNNVFKCCCPYCQKRFRTKYSCEQHLLKVHNSIEAPVQLSTSLPFNCVNMKPAPVEPEMIQPNFTQDKVDATNYADQAIMEHEIIYARPDSDYVQNVNCVQQPYVNQNLLDAPDTGNCCNQNNRAYFSDLLNDITIPQTEEEFHLGQNQIPSNSNYINYNNDEAGTLQTFTGDINMQNQPGIYEENIYLVSQTPQNQINIPFDSQPQDHAQNENVIILQSAQQSNNYQSASYSNMNYSNINDQIDDLVDQYASDGTNLGNLSYNQSKMESKILICEKDSHGIDDGKMIFPNIPPAEDLYFVNDPFPTLEVNTHKTSINDLPCLFVCGQCGDKFIEPSLLESHVSAKHKLSNTPYVCRFCTQMHKCEIAIMQHVRIHETSIESDETGSFICSACDKVFKSRTSLCVHIYFSHPPHQLPNYKCGQCMKPFQCASRLKNHLIKRCMPLTDSQDWLRLYGNSGRNSKKLAQESRNVCNQSAKKIKKPCVREKCAKLLIKTRKQKNSQKQNRYVCSECNLWYTSLKMLQTHMLMHREISITDKVSCTVCGYTTNNLKDYRDHRDHCELPQVPYKVRPEEATTITTPEVTQVESNAIELNRDCLSIALRDRVDESNLLTAHEVFTETGEQYYVIPMSENGAVSESMRLTESEYMIFNVDTNTYVPLLYSYPIEEELIIEPQGSPEVRNVPDDLVDKQIDMLVSDTLVEESTGVISKPNMGNTDKGHNCQECGLFVKEKTALDRHIRTHTGQKPFECADCGSWFEHESTLKQHMDSHVLSRRYHCKYCKHRFTSLKHLNRHAKVAHNMK